MEKKPLRVAYNVLGVLAALTVPTVFVTLLYVPPYRHYFMDLSYPLSFLLLLLLVLPPFITLFRKNSRFYLLPLYAAVIGFAISSRMTQFLLPFVSEEGWKLYTRGVGDNVGWRTGWGNFAYSYPLAALSLLFAVLLTVFYLRKKRKAASALTANLAPDSDSSAPKNP